MNKWLANLVLRIDISILDFLTAAATALVIAWATVAGHMLRITNTKPVVTLNYE